MQFRPYITEADDKMRVKRPDRRSTTFQRGRNKLYPYALSGMDVLGYSWVVFRKPDAALVEAASFRIKFGRMPKFHKFYPKGDVWLNATAEGFQNAAKV